MYSSAHESVRRPQFEVFWFTHHLFIPFYFFQLVREAPSGSGTLSISTSAFLGQPSHSIWFPPPNPHALPALSQIHGAGGYLEPPSFWKWFIVPGSLYAVERALRIVKGNQDTVLVDAIAHPSRVLEIRFQKATFNYKSGMYLFLCCPYIYKHGASSLPSPPLSPSFPSSL